MSFVYPLGFLALLAIPVLILIYIIKSRFTEQTITSTYLWTLSERFLKRKNPIQRITGLISLILQILAVILIAIAVAHPVFTLPGRADDFCFILDGSGSMNVVQSGTTRFDRAKAKISEIISASADGSAFTLVTTGNTTDVVFKDNDDKKSALRYLDSLEPSYVASDFNNAVTVAQNYFSDNPAMTFYLVTDKFYDNLENVTLINVAGEETNRAVTAAEYSFTADGGTEVEGKVLSYQTDGRVTVNLFVNDGGTPVDSVELDLVAGEATDFVLNWDGSEFATLRIALGGSDSLALDDEILLYSPRADEGYRTLIVSKSQFFIEAALLAMGNIERTIVEPDKYTDNLGAGYGLYIFESFSPDVMPKDGAVWFVNPVSNVEGSGFTVRGGEELAGPAPMQLSTSSSTKVKNLLTDTVPGDVTSIKQYTKCGLYGSFLTLMSCNSDPIVFAGSNSYGNREVVFSFNMGSSDFPLSYNGRVLMHNLINYTFPDLVDETSFYCGDTMSVNVLANCTGIRVEAPSGKAEYLDTSSAISEYELTEVGEYKITAIIGNNTIGAKVYSSLPEAERNLFVNSGSFILAGEAGGKKRDGKYEDLLYAFIVLAIIVAADWMVYCYEQYQLR